MPVSEPAESFLNLRIAVRLLIALASAVIIFSCSGSDPDLEPGSDNGDFVRNAEDFNGVEWEAPEPGSGPMEEVDRVASTDGRRRNPRDPVEVSREQFLVLPREALPQPVPPRDTELGRELAGDFLTDPERELYRDANAFLAAYSGGEIASEFVSPDYAESIRRRLEPAMGTDSLPEAWRIARPEMSVGGAAVPVRLFASQDSVEESVTGTLYLDESGLVEDVQIDVRSLGVR